MNFEEHAAKPLLAAAGLAVPQGRLCQSAAEAEAAALEIGPCVVKAQVAAGKRGKAGGIRLAATPAETRNHAQRILGMTIVRADQLEGGLSVDALLVEAQVAIRQELYAAVLSDPASKAALLLFSAEGGICPQILDCRRQSGQDV